jgi:hypothetical protein
MTAGIYNATIDQGSVWSVVFVYLNPSDVAINLTGYTARLQLRQNYNSAAADLTLTTENGGISIVGATGIVTVTATDEQTELLEGGFYLYDLELSASGVVSRLVQGQITVAEQVTRG